MLELMRQQLKNGADPNYIATAVLAAGGVEESMTPLNMAAGFGHLPAVTLLIESGADVNMVEPIKKWALCALRFGERTEGSIHLPS